jgi:hypothetical protein
MAPSGILHISAFITLCEAYMGIEPHCHLWNHFFHTRLLPGSGMEAAILGGVDIYFKAGPVVNPYFHLPMSESMNRWEGRHLRAAPHFHEQPPCPPTQLGVWSGQVALVET